MKLLTLKINKIITNINQPRKYFDEKKLKELKLSIKNNGLIQPIVVKKLMNGNFEIIAGERRYRACKELGFEEIKAIKIDVEDKKGYELSILENIQRENLNPIEEAESYVMLMDLYGYKQEEIAEKMGKTRSSISNKIRLLKLPNEIKEMVKNNILSYGQARTLLSLPEEINMEEMAEKIIKEKYTVREIEKIVKKYSYKKNNKNLSKTENDIKIDNENDEKNFIEEKLRNFFETKVSIKGELIGSGKIEIEFFDYDELSRIIGIMNIDFE